MNTLITK